MSSDLSILILEDKLNSNSLEILKWFKTKERERKREYVKFCENLEKEQLSIRKKIQKSLDLKDELIGSLMQDRKKGRNSKGNQDEDLIDATMIERDLKERELIKSFKSLVKIWKSKSSLETVKFLECAELATLNCDKTNKRAKQAILIGNELMKLRYRVKYFIADCNSIEKEISKIDYMYEEFQKLDISYQNISSRMIGKVTEIRKENTCRTYKEF